MVDVSQVMGIIGSASSILGVATVVVSAVEYVAAKIFGKDLFAKKLYDHVSKLTKKDPYKLQGKILSFKTLHDMIKNDDLSSNGTFKLAFVVSSCRDLESSGTHSALSTDLAFCPEIALQVRQLHEKNIEVATLFDIDVDETCREDWNLVVTGGGNINRVTREIFEHYREMLGVRPSNPTATDLYGLAKDDTGEKVHYTAEESSDYGALIPCVNFWAQRKRKNRIIIIAFGLTATGTMAALKVLYDSLKNPEKAENNKYDPNNPSHVIAGRLKWYDFQLKKSESLKPAFDVRSLQGTVCIE